jgi:hypothetical protein
MDEHLAIKSDRADDWRKKKEHRIKYDLRPRQHEMEKSSWAHDLDDDCDLGELLELRPRTCCKLHALAFLLKQETDKPGARFHVSVITIQRSAFRPDDVEEQAADHPVRGIAASHRLLRTKEESKIDHYAKHILADEVYRVLFYDLSEFQILLRFLVERDEITDKFLPAAQRLLDRLA